MFFPSQINGRKFWGGDAIVSMVLTAYAVRVNRSLYLFSICIQFIKKIRFLRLERWFNKKFSESHFLQRSPPFESNSLEFRLKQWIRSNNLQLVELTNGFYSQICISLFVFLSIFSMGVSKLAGYYFSTINLLVCNRRLDFQLTHFFTSIGSRANIHFVSCHPKHRFQFQI